MPAQPEILKYPNLNHGGIVVPDMDEAEQNNSQRFGLSGVVRRTILPAEGALYRGKRVSYSAG